MPEAIQGLKIGVGTKIDDVYSDKEAFEQARSADKNGDHVIDKDELNRYVGPVFAENVTTKEGRIEGSMVIPTCYGYKNGHLSAVILKDNEVDYYPGLTLDKVKNGRNLKTFANIDLDGNQKLSAEEIVLYPKKLKLESKKNEKNYNEARSADNKKSAKICNILGGIIGGLAGAGTYFLATISSGVLGGPILLGVLAAAGIGAVIGYTMFKLTEKLIEKDDNNIITNINKEIKELETQVQNETQQILGKTKEAK